MKKKMIQKKAEKQTADRQNIVEENKANKIKENEMLDRLDELNSKLNKIKTSNKEPIIIF